MKREVPHTVVDLPTPDFPSFDLKVAPGGYAWWYLDGLSDDGRHGVTLIAFLGSVFSPYYARARRRGRADPMHHCAVNVALYGGRKRWALTERGRSAVQRRRNSFVVGPSSLRWDGRYLVADIDEITSPLPSRIRGQVRIEPSALVREQFTLDNAGRHLWWPVAPVGRIEVDLQRPHLRWQGSSYFDHNQGSEALEEAFEGWDWSRARAHNGTTVFYDVRRRDGSVHSLALHFEHSGEVRALQQSSKSVDLGCSGWRVCRHARVRADRQATLLESLEDTPFYARTLLSTDPADRAALAVHESLSLQRFRNPLVQLMLPFRMPRRARWRRPGSDSH